MSLKERFQSASRKQKILVITVILILLLLIILSLYLLLTKSKTIAPQAVNQSVNATNQATNAAPNINTVISTTYISNESIAQAKETVVKQEPALLIAIAFTERLGSFSNQSNYQNFVDIEVFMAENVKNWLQNYVENIKKEHPEFGDYYGLTTKVISSDVRLLDEEKGEAEIMLTTQRQEFKGSNINPQIYYQDILVKLTKSGDKWLVTGAYWQ